MDSVTLSTRYILMLHWPWLYSFILRTYGQIYDLNSLLPCYLACILWLLNPIIRLHHEKKRIMRWQSHRVCSWASKASWAKLRKNIHCLLWRLSWPKKLIARTLPESMVPWAGPGLMLTLTTVFMVGRGWKTLMLMSHMWEPSATEEVSWTGWHTATVVWLPLSHMEHHKWLVCSVSCPALPSHQQERCGTLRILLQ